MIKKALVYGGAALPFICIVIGLFINADNGIMVKGFVVGIVIVLFAMLAWFINGQYFGEGQPRQPVISRSAITILLVAGLGASVVGLSTGTLLHEAMSKSAQSVPGRREIASTPVNSASSSTSQGPLSASGSASTPASKSTTTASPAAQTPLTSVTIKNPMDGNRISQTVMVNGTISGALAPGHRLWFVNRPEGVDEWRPKEGPCDVLATLAEWDCGVAYIGEDLPSEAGKRFEIAIVDVNPAARVEFDRYDHEKNAGFALPDGADIVAKVDVVRK